MIYDSKIRPAIQIDNYDIIEALIPLSSTDVIVGKPTKAKEIMPFLGVLEIM